MVPPSTIAFLVTFVLGLSRAQEKDLARIPAIGPWIYSGCANETPAGRTLNGPSISGNMTAERCLTFCTNQDYPLAGLEYGNEYCTFHTLPIATGD